MIRWTREIILGAGIDVGRFRSYSVKAAGVGNAARSLSLKSILSAVGWRRESTSRMFYQMPVVDQGEFGAAVLAHLFIRDMVAVVILSLVDFVWLS